MSGDQAASLSQHTRISQKSAQRHVERRTENPGVCKTLLPGSLLQKLLHYSRAFSIRNLCLPQQVSVFVAHTLFLTSSEAVAYRAQRQFHDLATGCQKADVAALYCEHGDE